VERRRLCVLPLFSVASWESVVTLAVTGNTIAGRVVRHMNISVSREHRLSLTGSLWDILLMSGRG
jgi:hypothetical protein